MRKTNYVPTTLDQYINESTGNITLKRGYKDKNPVVVGANAPIRNQILSFVAESKSVPVRDLKKFIAGLNETNSNPNAAATMWIRRNERFFIAENKGGHTFYKLSSLGERLVNRFAPPVNENESQKVNEKKKYDFKDPKTEEPGITDSDEGKDIKKKKKKEVDEACSKTNEEIDEKKRARIERLIENIKGKTLKTLKTLNEADEEEKDGGEEGDEGSSDDLSFDDLDLTGEEGEGSEEEKESGEGEESGEESEGENEEGEGENEEGEGENEGEDEKVEITEFIITVDDVSSAIEELSEKGVDAEKVVDPDGEPGEGEEESYKEDEISVPAEQWEELKGWLEEKGVDVEEMFGGEIEVEDEEVDLEGGEGEGGDDLEVDLEGGEGEGGNDLEVDIEGGEGEGGEISDDDLELDLEGGEEVEESLTGMENHEDDTNNLVKGAKQVIINYK
jgi:hypothetical protein